jgi:hypothetical protein
MQMLVVHLLFLYVSTALGLPVMLEKFEERKTPHFLIMNGEVCWFFQDDFLRMLDCDVAALDKNGPPFDFPPPRQPSKAGNGKTKNSKEPGPL